jgi:outer membrane protein OmpA-like peptidoglycan-associated protein
MLKEKKHILLILIIMVILTPLDIKSQLIDATLRDIEITSQKDTLLINRTPGDWWFGPFFSLTPQTNFYFGKLIIPENIFPGWEQFNNILHYSGGIGWGYNLGIFSEWKKKENQWGINLKISLIDYKTSKTNLNANDSLQTTYENQTTYSYITISPAVRFDLNFLSGLYWFSGFDFSIPLNAFADQLKSFRNPEIIQEKRKINYSALNFRGGLNIGLGYDFFSASISKYARSSFSTYILLNGGTNLLSDWGSNYNGISLQVGIIIKIGADKRQIDTLPFNPNYVEPPAYLASVARENGVYFSGFHENSIGSADLSYFEIPIISKIVPDTSEISSLEVKVPETKPFEQKKQIVITPNKMVSFEFGKNINNTTLSKEMKEYISAVADFLKQNPGYRVIVEGHTDDRGTRDIQNKISTERSTAAMQELRNKGVPSGRIISRGRGALVPLVPNTSEANRAKNRRLEIMVERMK